MTVAEVIDEAPDVRTFRLSFQDEAVGRRPSPSRPASSAMYSRLRRGRVHLLHRLGATRKGYIECSFREVGRVTAALRDNEVGDTSASAAPTATASRSRE